MIKVERLTKKMLNKNISLSKGNKKLVGDQENSFIIWNIPAIITCPWKTGNCKKFCYAVKAERVYPTVLPCRTRNWEEAEKESFINDMILHIKWHTEKKSNKGKNIWFRIHESGDFYNQAYFDKWVKIASEFPQVNFLAYTKSVKFMNETELEIPSNLVIRFSVWDDTNAAELEIAKKLQLPIYTAFDPATLEEKIVVENYVKCDCDCSKCKMCYTGKIKKLAVAIH